MTNPAESTLNTARVTLTEFLRARIDEDEAAMRADLVGRDYPNPDRTRAECEAKRRIVEFAMPGERDDAGERFRILRILAEVYSDHPDHQQEWRP